MADGLNKVLILGNLGADPELRYTQSGKAVLRMRLAVGESYYDRNEGKRQEKTEWFTVVLWDKRAEGLNKILTKGSRICVEGRLQTRKWEDKEGNTRHTTEVVGHNVVLCGGGKKRDDEPRGDMPPGDDGGWVAGAGDFDDSNIPF